MSKFSTKEAAKRFYEVLREAETRPVVINRHRRPRAVVMSISRFRLYEKILAHVAEDAAIGAMEEALWKAREGRLGLAHRALKDSALLKDISAPGPGDRADEQTLPGGEKARPIGAKTPPSGKIDPTWRPR
jgi:prevent-host-death family protein